MILISCMISYCEHVLYLVCFLIEIGAVDKFGLLYYNIMSLSWRVHYRRFDCSTCSGIKLLAGFIFTTSTSVLRTVTMAKIGHDCTTSW